MKYLEDFLLLFTRLLNLLKPIINSVHLFSQIRQYAAFKNIYITKTNLSKTETQNFPNLNRQLVIWEDTYYGSTIHSLCLIVQSEMDCSSLWSYHKMCYCPLYGPVELRCSDNVTGDDIFKKYLAKQPTTIIMEWVKVWLSFCWHNNDIHSSTSTEWLLICWSLSY